MIGTGRKPFFSSSHSETSSAPSSGSVKVPRSSACAPSASKATRTAMNGRVMRRSLQSRSGLPPSAAAAAATAHAAALESSAAAVLLRALVAHVARLVLPVEGLARLRSGGSLLRAVRRLLRRPLAAASNVGPALALAAVCLPIAALVAAVHLAVAAGVDVVVRALGEGRIADLLGLPVGGQLARLGAVAPAVVAVVDVDVVVMADVHATAAVAARMAPAPARGEAPEKPDAEPEAPAVRRRRRIPIGADIHR